MSLINIKRINKSYGLQQVLLDINFGLERRQKIALIGHNGTGKSTLLKIIAGLEESDSGKVYIAKGVKVGYLPQDASLVNEKRVDEYLLMQADQPEALDDLHCSEEGKLIRIKVLLAGFGLTEDSLSQTTGSLSSGQKTKVALIKILLSNPDVLLLDEPTNNLDMPALVWLEQYLTQSDAGYLITSHDRRFLDRVAKSILELNWSTHTTRFEHGRYSDYLKRRTEEINQLKNESLNQKEEKNRLNQTASNLKIASAKGAKYQGTDNAKMARDSKRDRAGSSSKRAKAIENRIDQMPEIEVPAEREPFTIPLKAKLQVRSFRVELKDAVAGYADSFEIGPLTLTLSPGERLAILGLNGSGKSTLLKTLTGGINLLAGERNVGSKVTIGNLMQEHENLPREETLLRFIKSRTNLKKNEVFHLLVKFAFDISQITGKISALSPGGRARLLLALFAAQSVNFLVLDEPTNHLDLEALEALEELLASYQGTVVIVSHDRYFLEAVKLDQTYVLKDGKLNRLPDLEAYIEEIEQKANKMIRLLK